MKNLHLQNTECLTEYISASVSVGLNNPMQPSTSNSCVRM